MRTLLFLLALIITGCGCSWIRPPEPLPQGPSVAEAFDAANGAIIALADPDTHEVYCSGVWVDSSHALTAAHCVDDTPTGEHIFIGLYQGYDSETDSFSSLYPVLLVRSDEEDDVALLRWDFSTIPPAHTALPVLERDPQLGETIFAFGHAYGYGYHISEGRVTHPNRGGSMFGDGMSWTQHSAYTTHGMSGGPVTTFDGHLLGLNSFYIGQAPNGSPISGCTHVSSLRAILTPVE